MISDFNHLLKCFRTSTLDDNLQEFQTPYGIVKKKHWEALLEEENYRQPNMKIAYKLTPAHLKPKGFQTMNVPLATQAILDFLQFLEDWEKVEKNTCIKEYVTRIKSNIARNTTNIENVIHGM
ncbi:unnamed protein product [Parnassius mnemosyne]|uniref:Uncharacterized protein n=1 Tax=Parnassius mnemosyne TaxID=213953 RepID=A0AAV1KZF5_9NEOP